METKYYAMIALPEYFRNFEDIAIGQLTQIKGDYSNIFYTMDIWDCKGNTSKYASTDVTLLTEGMVEINKQVFNTLKKNAEKIKKLIEIQNTTIESLFKNLIANDKEKES